VPELDLNAILEELVRGDVEFLVIGGVAVGYHGHIRATKDLDIVPAPDAANLARLARTLEGLDTEIEGAEESENEELPDPLDPEALALGGLRGPGRAQGTSRATGKRVRRNRTPSRLSESC
jgi:hypothetical protein